MRKLMEHYPRTTAYIAVMVTLILLLQMWEAVAR